MQFEVQTSRVAFPRAILLYSGCSGEELTWVLLAKMPAWLLNLQTPGETGRSRRGFGWQANIFVKFGPHRMAPCEFALGYPLAVDLRPLRDSHGLLVSCCVLRTRLSAQLGYVGSWILGCAGSSMTRLAAPQNMARQKWRLHSIGRQGGPDCCHLGDPGMMHSSRGFSSVSSWA